VKKLLVILLASLWACNPKQEKSPKLVIILSVDQMRGDLLTEFSPVLSKGLHKIQNNSLQFSNTFHNHSCTNTAVGHASISTGCNPKKHGITGNSIYNRAALSLEYAVADSTTVFQGVENTTLRKVSPKNIERPSYGDIIRESNPQSKSFSVSLKDRTSVIMGGHHANRSFWFDAESTQMISNSHYGGNFPDWAENYKGSQIMEKEIEEGWHFEVPKDRIPSFTATDSSIYESGRFRDYFPHTFDTYNPSSTSNKRVGNFLWNTPFGDKFLLEFAKTLIENEDLGKDDHVDALSIGLSSSDYIGHHFGPKSWEVLDYFHKLDHYLNDFIAFLDSAVGKESYILVLTSDHGACDIPERNDPENVAVRVSSQQYRTDLKNIGMNTMQELGLSDYPIDTMKYNGIEPNFESIRGTNIDSLTLVNALCSGLNSLYYIDETFNGFELKNRKSDKDYYGQYYNNFHQTKSLFIEFLNVPNSLINKSKNGSNHGSPYEYDTSVPLLFYGAIPKKIKMRNEVYSTDITPTLLGLLNITTSHEFDGEDIIKKYVK
jgi:predicted AlkP superfamily pyrophosphatase or phosphodiesterase